MTDQNIRRRFEEMLPWYVNGTLEPESRQWFEAQLATHPELHAELRLTEAMRTQVRAAAPDIAPDLGLDRLMQRLHAERSASRPRAHAPARPSPWQRVTALLEGFRLTPAFATAAAVIAIQAGVIGTLLMQQPDAESEYATFRSIGDGRIVTGPLIEVAFSADAREREIRELLVRIGGTLAGGPGQLGNYLVFVPAEHLDDAVRILEAAAVVEAATIVPDTAPGR